MDLGRTAILTEVPENNYNSHQRFLMDQQASGTDGGGGVSGGGGGGSETVVRTFGGGGNEEVQSTNNSGVFLADVLGTSGEDHYSYNDDAATDNTTTATGVRAPTSMKPVASKDIKAGQHQGSGASNKRKSMTDIVDQITIKLAKIDACNDDGYLRLPGDKVSECKVNKLIRAALSKSCKPDNNEEFIKYLVQAKVDPNLFQNDRFKNKMMSMINSHSKSREPRVKQVAAKKKNVADMNSKKKERSKNSVSNITKNERLVSVFDETTEEENDEAEILVTKIKPKKQKIKKNVDDNDDDDDTEEMIVQSNEVKGIKRKRGVLEEATVTENDSDDGSKRVAKRRKVTSGGGSKGKRAGKSGTVGDPVFRYWVELK